MTDKIDSQEALSAWVREQFQKANKHLAEKAILYETVVIEDCRYLAPKVAVWKIKDTKKNFYWVISGDVPADVLPASVATSAREAIKHFSLSWQLRASNILEHVKSDQLEKDYANLLIEKADLLYEVQAEDKWWQNE